ncbi:MAG: hypothetical protein ABSG86_17310 [Thermoguttaceae bacterium]
MPRGSRIRLVIGLSLALGGLLVAYAAGPVVAHLSFFHPGDLGWGFQAAMVLWYLVPAAFAVGTASAIYAFVVFAVWFIGPQEER